MDQQDANIHAVVIYNLDASYKEKISKLACKMRANPDTGTWFQKTDFLFCKNLNEVKDLAKGYEYTIVIINFMSPHRELHQLHEFVKDLPGYHDVTYKHFTCIKTDLINDDLQLILKHIPICLIADRKEINDEQVAHGLSSLASLFGPTINYPSLEKFFDLYHECKYKEAFDIAQIFHRRYPNRELINTFYQSARLSLNYVQDSTSEDFTYLSSSPEKSNFGLLNYTKELIATRDLFKKGFSDEAIEQFTKIVENIGGHDKLAIQNILLFLLEKFVVTNKYAHQEAALLDSKTRLLSILEPEMSFENLIFDKLKIHDINKSMYCCRLGVELAIMANVVGYCCSKINDHSTAAKLYATAFCFAYNNIEISLKTLHNLLSSYKKNGALGKARIVENEIIRLESEHDRDQYSWKQTG